jgi:hypothetical protein
MGYPYLSVMMIVASLKAVAGLREVALLGQSSGSRANVTDVTMAKLTMTQKGEMDT